MLNSVFEILLLAFTLFSESSGENIIGMQATSNVIRNRVESKYYKNNYYDVIMQPYQFSCMNNKAQIKRNIKRIVKNDVEYRSFLNACRIAFKTYYKWNCDDVTDGATHYTTLKTHKKWFANVTYIKNIGNHKYFKM